MTISIPLTVLLALSTTAQGPAAGAKAADVAPFVGEEVALAAQFDLARWDVPTSARRIFGKLAEDADLAGATQVLDGWVAALKKAGATDLFVLVDLGDMPGYPVVVVPLPGKADARAISELLKGGRPDLPLGWPAVETIRGAVVAGSPEALARIRGAKPAIRPEFSAALAGGGDALIRLAIVPSASQRRALEESMPNLPPPLGGGPITSVSRGMTWASITLATEPSPRLRMIVQAKDADSAKALRKVAQDGLDQLASAARANLPVAELADAIARMKPEATGDRVVLDADLEKTAALVSVPVRQFRESARRSACVNNLKQIALAMHNYHSAKDTFPPAYAATKDGKPLLSWRVLILPYLDEEELFKQFKLDEAWDSPSNKPLIARMPKVFACPTGSKALAGQGKTTYLTPRGPATMFPGAEGVKIQEITDGTSNTIMVVEAGDDLAVTWTRPDDWEVAPDLKTQGLFGHHPGGTNVGFGDGAVRFLKETVAVKFWQNLATRNGGEVIGADDY